MLDFEEFQKYFPHLPFASQQNLFKELDQFPPTIDQRLFTSRLEAERDVFQGDGLRDMPVTNLPDAEILIGPVMVLSNTCDTSFSNARYVSPSLIYCPIVPLSLYTEQHLTGGLPKSGLDDWLNRIRIQKRTRLFYLPKFGGLREDCVALLDHTCSCNMDYLTPESVPEKRIFSLSDIGGYYFIVKLAIHFLRPTFG